MRTIIPDAASVEKVPSPTLADFFAHPPSLGFPLGSDMSPSACGVAAGKCPWLGGDGTFPSQGNVPGCAPSAPWHEGDVPEWSRISLSRPWPRCSVTPRSRRARCDGTAGNEP